MMQEIADGKTKVYLKSAFRSDRCGLPDIKYIQNKICAVLYPQLSKHAGAKSHTIDVISTPSNKSAG